MKLLNMRSALGAVMLTAVAVSGAEMNWMPVPAKYTPGTGRLAIGQDFGIRLTGHTEPRLEAARDRTMGRISRLTGMPLSGSATVLTVECGGPSEKVQKFGEDESYTLEVDAKQARLKAANPLGVLRGLATFQQMIEQDGAGWSVQAMAVDDKPRFPWRGLSMDVSRHWQPMDVVLRTLDGMELVKLNVFHWHLSDDQGFRVECKKLPELTKLASDGHYYTQEDVKRVIAYARDRGIRVVPEFDVPGHTTAILTAFPNLGTVPGPYQIERKWGIFEPVLDPSKEAVYKFLDSLIGEMAGLFPDAYFHVGGDEVEGKQWKESPTIQAFMKAKGLKDNHELQRYFNRRLQPIVAKHGKRMEGWDEILDPDLPKDIVIQSWRGQKSLAEAARQGYSGLLSAGYYLDLHHSTARHYLVDPIDPKFGELKPEEKARILGGEAAVWSEYMTPENIDIRIWPRLAAIAERLWSPETVRDVDSMYIRLTVVSRRLALAANLLHRSNYEAMLERLAGTAPIEPIRTLASVVEPVKDYSRETLRGYTQSTPLNRLVDVARSDSFVAHEFERAIRSKDTERVRGMLEHWRDNKPVLEGLLAEAQPLADNLNRAAEIGLAALDGKPVDRATLEAMKKPRAEMLLSILPGVEMLVAEAK